MGSLTDVCCRRHVLLALGWMPACKHTRTPTRALLHTSACVCVLLQAPFLLIVETQQDDDFVDETPLRHTTASPGPPALSSGSGMEAATAAAVERGCTGGDSCAPAAPGGSSSSGPPDSTDAILQHSTSADQQQKQQACGEPAGQQQQQLIRVKLLVGPGSSAPGGNCGSREPPVADSPLTLPLGGAEVDDPVLQVVLEVLQLPAVLPDDAVGGGDGDGGGNPLSTPRHGRTRRRLPSHEALDLVAGEQTALCTRASVCVLVLASGDFLM
jgi:hypothetical protein